MPSEVTTRSRRDAIVEGSEREESSDLDVSSQSTSSDLALTTSDVPVLDDTVEIDTPTQQTSESEGEREVETEVDTDTEVETEVVDDSEFSQPGRRFYTVKSSDTLWDIATDQFSQGADKERYGDWSVKDRYHALARINGVHVPDEDVLSSVGIKKIDLRLEGDVAPAERAPAALDANFKADETLVIGDAKALNGTVDETISAKLSDMLGDKAGTSALTVQLSLPINTGKTVMVQIKAQASATRGADSPDLQSSITMEAKVDGPTDDKVYKAAVAAFDRNPLVERVGPASSARDAVKAVRELIGRGVQDDQVRGALMTGSLFDLS